MSIVESVKSVFTSAGSIPPEDLLPEPIIQRGYLVGGQIRLWNGPLEDVLSPICDETPAGPYPRRIGAYPILGPREALSALDAAEAAYANGRGAWPTASVAERIRCVEDFALKMVQRRAEVIRLLMWEIAKSRTDAEKEFDRTVTYIRDTIDAVKELDRASSRFSIEEGIIAQIRRSPLGVVLCMGPFNYPLNETFTTLIPALIMGNTAIVKPPKLGVLLYGPLLEAFRDAFPAGVVNFVYGPGPVVIPPLMESGRVDVLAFIGSSRVADTLKSQHPRPHRLRCVLGLDAKNPAVILPDADLDLAVSESVLGALSFNGQRCTALKILFVHRTLVEPFVQRLAEAVSRLKPGLPWSEAVAITPLPEPGKPARLGELIEDARARGARVVNDAGGTSHGTLVFPAVVYPVDARMRLWNEEQFGPIVPIVPFDDVEEPIRYVVESNFGQQISVFGRDPATIARLVDPFANQLCRVNLNSQCQRGPDRFPFTGRKDSAEGTLSVSDALRVFSIRTLVAAKGTEANKEILSTIVRERRSTFLSTDFIL
jgi:glyceraldehyde-3-phosphate dehydrogenase (NADP+)